MGRAAKTVALKPVAEFDDNALRADGETLDARASQLISIDEQFGGAVPYQRERVEAEAAFFFNQGSESFFEAGKRFVQLKAHEPHGEFIKALDRIGVGVRLAQRLMSVAMRFAHLKSLAKLPRSKLGELQFLEDEELEALDRGETVRGLTLDKVDRMGVHELRAAHRKADAELASQKEMYERLLADKNKKIDELATRPYQKWDDRMGEVIADLHKQTLFGSEALSRVLACVEAAAGLKLNHETELAQRTEFAARAINDVELLVARVAAVQRFVHDQFDEYVETGAKAVLTEPVQVSPRKKGS